MDADLTKYRQKLIGSDNERAVSPVIGVILMVAITVILAAVLAAFILDMGPTEADPQAGITIDDDESPAVEVVAESFGSSTDGVAIVDENGDVVDSITTPGGSVEVSEPGEYEVRPYAGDDNPGTTEDFERSTIHSEFTVVEVESIEIELADDEIEEGESTTATVTATYGDGSTGDLTEEADITAVTNDDDVTIEEDGTVTAGDDVTGTPKDVDIDAEYDGVESNEVTLTISS